MEQEITRNSSSSLSELYVIYQFSLYALALQAGVSRTTLEIMVQDQPVTRTAAEKVLNALSLRTGEQYTLNNVAVKLIEEGEAHAKRAK